MEPEGSLPYSQEPSTCHYPEPDQSNLYHPTILILFNHLRFGLPSFTTKKLTIIVVMSEEFANH
jgi:hypothetical protein